MSIPVAALQRLPLLSHLPQVTLSHLAQQVVERTFAKREVVLHKGRPASALAFLLDGRLQGVDFTLDDREVGLYFVNIDDYFGEVALLDGGLHPEFVTAVARSRVAFLPQESIKPILFAAPRMAEALCVRLASRLRDSAAQRRILGLSNPLQRVSAQLQLLMHPATAGQPARVPNAPTHQELAIMVNASRETVSRVFQLLQGHRVIERDGNDLRVEAPDTLRALAAGEHSLAA